MHEQLERRVAERLLNQSPRQNSWMSLVLACSLGLSVWAAVYTVASAEATKAQMEKIATSFALMIDRSKK